MQTSSLPVISNCIIVFDLQLQQYVTIGPEIRLFWGSANRGIEKPDFWHDMVQHDDAANLRRVLQDLEEGASVEVNYTIAAHNSTNIYHITEKRSLYTDTITGHKMLLSILNQYSPSDSYTNDKLGETVQGEQFLKSLINSQTNFLLRLDTSGRFTFVNKRYCEVFGYTEDELIGRHFAVNTAPEDMERCQLAFEQCIAFPGDVIPLVREKIDKSGGRHPTEWEFISITNDRGDITEIQGVGQDISQRLKSEDEVKRSEEQLNNFIESITDSFVILDKQWRFIKTNEAFQKTSNRTKEQLIGNDFWEVFPSLKGRVTEQSLKHAMETQETLKFTEYFSKLKRWYRVAAYPSAEGLTLFIKNITRQKLAEEELNQVRTNLETLINNTEDLIWSVDLNKKYIYTNAAYTNAVFEETGMVPAVGQDVIVFGPAETVVAWNTYYERALNGERYFVIYENLHSTPGEYFHYETYFNPIYDSANKVIGTGCFARDITSLLRSEKEIILQNERLRQIASLSSHELRRPVASMLGLINIIDFENFNNPDNKQTINYLLTVGREIDEVIRLIVNNTFTD